MKLREFVKVLNPFEIVSVYTMDKELEAKHEFTGYAKNIPIFYCDFIVSDVSSGDCSDDKVKEAMGDLYNYIEINIEYEGVKNNG